MFLTVNAQVLINFFYFFLAWCLVYSTFVPTNKINNMTPTEKKVETTVRTTNEAKREAKRREIERQIFDLYNDTDAYGNCYSDADCGL